MDIRIIVVLFSKSLAIVSSCKKISGFKTRIWMIVIVNCLSWSWDGRHRLAWS